MFKNLEKGSHKLNVMITKIETKTAKNGSEFLNVEVSDGEEKVSGVMFNTSLDELGYSVGDIVKADLSKSEYNGADNYKFIAFFPPDEGVKKEDFIISAPLTGDEMYNYVYNVLQNLQNKELSLLATTIYDNFKDQLLYWSAAKSHHHNIYGGLMYHTYRMVQLAEKMTDVYTAANKDLVIAGCALHDIGKIKELVTDEFGNADYSIDGNLFGHLYIGAELVKYFANKLKTDKEITRCLTHIIVSHHTNPEWGAISRPSTMEAWLVSQIDMTDSQFYTYETETAKLNPGEMSNDYLMGGIHIYRNSL